MKIVFKISDFKFDATMRRISPFNWSTDLRDLPQMNFLQLYDYLVVSARKDQHIVIRKLKSHQFFFEGITQTS